MALTDKLTAIADAIRSKGGTTEQLTLEGMVEAINAIETGSGATDVTDSVVSVAFSASNANAVRAGFDGMAQSDAKMEIFFWCGDKSNAVNNQCLFAILQRLYLTSNTTLGGMLFCRWRNSSYDFQLSSNSSYDLIVNVGDTFRMVVIR